MRLNRLTAIISLLLLSACGGGGGGGGSNPPATTITSVTVNTRHGMVVSPSSQNITIKGTNFASGMTVSIVSPTGIVSLTNITPTSIDTVSNPNTMIVPVTISTAPGENYVAVSIKSGNTIVATQDAFGVASTDQYLLSGTTPIQSILSAKCAGCHSGAAPHYLDLSNGALTNSTGIIDIGSTYCSQKKRVVAGDPRRTSSMLLDRIMPTPANLPCNNSPMPPMGTTLSPSELTALIDWVAGGAK